MSPISLNLEIYECVIKGPQKLVELLAKENQQAIPKKNSHRVSTESTNTISKKANNTLDLYTYQLLLIE
jgi:hypothetical protein